MEAKKSYDLLSTRWRTRKLVVYFQQSLIVREPGEMMMKLIVQGQRPGIVGATGISPRV